MIRTLYATIGMFSDNMASMLLVSQKNHFNSTSSKVDISVNNTNDDYLGVSYRWFHNGIPLPTSSKTTFQPQQVKLTLDNPSLLNDGMYETETPLTEFTAESSSLPATHTTTLTCTATGGYPPVDSITLYKNNELIMRTSSGALQYNTTTSSQYGRYQCVIDSVIHTVRKSLLLQEEGKLHFYTMQL